MELETYLKKKSSGNYTNYKEGKIKLSEVNH